MDMPINYHVWGATLIISKTHAKGSKYHTEIKDRFVDDTG